ncbi:hypothetical protein CYMTET_52758 [Cymbomonas tetramitiformis]|uniref:Uncharacterized protein n=1 Tax=Cymbomonas tetramitiformis TaxID=36881 RepID=A0AAE0BID8_9CHLO|nr:hypothetical protein CYMTET_52758 [Cymbomonas tetramitiformis]
MSEKAILTQTEVASIAGKESDPSRSSAKHTEDAVHQVPATLMGAKTGTSRTPVPATSLGKTSTIAARAASGKASTVAARGASGRASTAQTHRLSCTSPSKSARLPKIRSGEELNSDGLASADPDAQQGIPLRATKRSGGGGGGWAALPPSSAPKGLFARARSWFTKTKATVPIFLLGNLMRSDTGREQLAMPALPTTSPKPGVMGPMKRLRNVFVQVVMLVVFAAVTAVRDGLRVLGWGLGLGRSVVVALTHVLIRKARSRAARWRDSGATKKHDGGRVGPDARRLAGNGWTALPRAVKLPASAVESYIGRQQQLQAGAATGWRDGLRVLLIFVAGLGTLAITLDTGMQLLGTEQGASLRRAAEHSQ